MTPTLLTLAGVCAGLAVALYLHKKFKEIERSGWPDDLNPDSTGGEVPETVKAHDRALRDAYGRALHPIPGMKISHEASADIINFPGLKDVPADAKVEDGIMQINGEPVKVVTEKDVVRILLKCDSASLHGKTEDEGK